MLTLLKTDIEEAVRALGPLIHIRHHRVRRQDLLAIDKKRDGCFFAQVHAFADDRVELNRLEVVRDQESSAVNRY